MTYTLHSRLGSGGFAVEAVLTAAGIKFDYHPMASKPDVPLGPGIAHLNPWQQVPVLELEDGTIITETAAILTYLSQKEASLKNGPVLWVDDPAQFLRWSVFLSVNIYEGILRKSYPARYVSGYPASTAPLITGSVRDAAIRRVHEAFTCIEQATSDHAFLLGERMSPCDVFLAMLYAWHNQRPDLPKCTWITRQVATHEAIRPIWKRNFHDRLDFKWHEL